MAVHGGEFSLLRKVLNVNFRRVADIDGATAATLKGAGFMSPSSQTTRKSPAAIWIAMERVLLKVGPLGRILRENLSLRLEAEPRVRVALAARGNAGHVALRATTWIVSARA